MSRAELHPSLEPMRQQSPEVYNALEQRLGVLAREIEKAEKAIEETQAALTATAQEFASLSESERETATEHLRVLLKRLEVLGFGYQELKAKGAKLEEQFAHFDSMAESAPGGIIAEA